MAAKWIRRYLRPNVQNTNIFGFLFKYLQRQARFYGRSLQNGFYMVIPGWKQPIRPYTYEKQMYEFSYFFIYSAIRKLFCRIDL